MIGRTRLKIEELAPGCMAAVARKAVALSAHGPAEAARW